MIDWIKLEALIALHYGTNEQEFLLMGFEETIQKVFMIGKTMTDRGQWSSILETVFPRAPYMGKGKTGFEKIGSIGVIR